MANTANGFWHFSGRTGYRILAMTGLLLALLAAPARAQTATYDGSNRYLTMPSVQVLDTVYGNVVIRLDNVSVLNTGTGTAASTNAGAPATYDATQRTLTIPMLSALGAVYYGLVARLESFALISVGASSPAVDQTPVSDRYYYY